MKRSVFAIAVMLLWPALAEARPVSYSDAWTLMTMNDGDTYSLHAHYSLTAKYSVGYKAEYWRDDDWQFHGLQFNYLAKRWNKPASQANFYVKSALGTAYSDAGSWDGEFEPAGFIGIAADWEDRRFFTMYENRYMDAGEFGDFYMQKARVGVAPYVGDYGDLHTWLMLQVSHNPEGRHAMTYTPMVRLFKGPVLTEFGISNHGDIMTNLVIRF